MTNREDLVTGETVEVAFAAWTSARGNGRESLCAALVAAAPFIAAESERRQAERVVELETDLSALRQRNDDLSEGLWCMVDALQRAGAWASSVVGIGDAAARMIEAYRAGLEVYANPNDARGEDDRHAKAVLAGFDGSAPAQPPAHLQPDWECPDCGGTHQPRWGGIRIGHPCPRTQP